MSKVPEKFRKFVRRYPAVAKAYEEYAGACHRAGPLCDRERVLIKLGIATGSNAEGSVKSQVRKALDLGVSPEEIRHAILLAPTAIGLPLMMEALYWAEEILGAGDLEGGAQPGR